MTLIALFLGFALATAPAPASPAAPSEKKEERTVTKASVYLVKSPSFLAPRVSSTVISRGQKVTIEGAPQGAWYQVSYKPRRGARVTGFLHRSYMSERPVVFQVQDREVSGKGAVSRSVNLAVPGFSEEVASRREKARKDLKKGYRVVNAYMPGSEAAIRRQVFPPDPRPLLAFARAGRLHDPAAPPDTDGAELASQPPPTQAPSAAPATAGTAATASPAPVPSAPPAPAGPVPGTTPSPDPAAAPEPASDPSEWNTL